MLHQALAASGTCAADATQLRGRLLAEGQLGALAALAAAAGEAEEALQLWRVGPHAASCTMSDRRQAPWRVDIEKATELAGGLGVRSGPAESVASCSAHHVGSPCSARARLSCPFYVPQEIGQSGGSAAGVAAAQHAAALLADVSRASAALVLQNLPWLAQTSPAEALSVLKVGLPALWRAGESRPQSTSLAQCTLVIRHTCSDILLLGSLVRASCRHQASPTVASETDALAGAKLASTRTSAAHQPARIKH